MNFIPANPAKKLDAILRQAEILLSKEPKPRQTIRYLAMRLAETSLAPELPTNSPQAFLINLKAALMELDPGAIQWPTRRLVSYETAEELILDLIPNAES